MASYTTEVHTGQGGWQPYQPLSLSIAGRGDAIPQQGGPTEGTTVTWSSPESGNASVTFFDGGTRFHGSTQFPGEGPVEYRGVLAH